jgi:hypothetical protein
MRLRPRRTSRDISTRRAGREAPARTRGACWAEAPFYDAYSLFTYEEAPTPAKGGR